MTPTVNNLIKHAVLFEPWIERDSKAAPIPLYTPFSTANFAKSFIQIYC